MKIKKIKDIPILDDADLLSKSWKKIPTNNITTFIEKILYSKTLWAVFEPNNEKLWARIRLQVGQFMQKLFQNGVLKGTKPKEAFFVKIDRETTTQDDIDKGIIMIEVGFAPLKPAEFVVIKIQQGRVFIENDWKEQSKIRITKLETRADKQDKEIEKLKKINSLKQVKKKKS